MNMAVLGKIRLPGYLATNIQKIFAFCHDRRLLMAEALFDGQYHIVVFDYNKKKLISALPVRIFPWDVCSTCVYVPKTKQLVIGSYFQTTLHFYNLYSRRECTYVMKLGDSQFNYPSEFELITDDALAVVSTFNGVKIVNCEDKSIKCVHERLGELRSIKAYLNKHFLVVSTDLKFINVIDCHKLEILKTFDAQSYKADVFSYH